MFEALTARNEGSSGVEPIRSQEDIERIRKVLEARPRDLLLFELATQTGLRVQELLRLKVKDLLGLKAGDPLNPQGNDKPRGDGRLLTGEVLQTFRYYLEESGPGPEDYLFKSRKGEGPLTLSSVSHLVRSWFEAAGVQGPRGAKSLHKTWEYHGGPPPSGVPGTERDPGAMVHVEPPDTSTLQQRVYDSLFEAIVSGRIRPGARMTAKEISKRLKVSPMPVREALSRLEATGFVFNQKKKGTIVRELSVKDLKEITTIRLTLETLAARQACMVRSEQTLDQLESLMKEYLSADEAEEFLRINRRFHQTLYHDADMPTLLQLIVGLWDRISPYLHLYVLTIEDLDLERRPSAECHKGMVDGMRRKDAPEVVHWLKSDLKRCYERTLKIVKSL